MMQPDQLLVPTWPNFSFDQDIEFSYSFDDVPTMIVDELYDSCNEILTWPAMEELDSISRRDIEDMCEWIYGDDHDQSMEGDGCSPPLSSESSVFAQLDEPAMEVDHQLMLNHLLQAYGEAMENGQKELAEVIGNSISGKSSPVGNATERVAYNLIASKDGQGEYLHEESSKNLPSAFMALYQSLPNGRFAHFTANSAILDSIPDDVRTIHVVDFDMGDGVQWPPFIETLSRSGKGIAVKLTSVRSEDELPSCWDFGDTKNRLLSHAKQCGLSLEIEEKSLEEVGNEMVRRKKREWVAFNCMVGLPHMGRRRRRRGVDGFLREAKALAASHGGILVLGDGEAMEGMNSCGYAAYFDSLLGHYRAVFESLEMNFPVHLAEARAAMESLFLAPFMCPVAWFRDWEEMGRSCDFQAEMWSRGRKLSRGSLVEARDMVVEGESYYSVQMEGMMENEMVLRWKETPLVRVSAWM